MTRYIDADNIKWEEVEYSHGKRNETVVDCRIAVDNAPTIDAVEVVRCKECRKRKYCEGIYYDFNEMDYCAHGERETK